jgi:NADPH-dependent methylglyoxal reductase
MSKVLLTGITGFIAAHILELLVKNKYIVVGTLRNVSRADFIKEKYPDADIAFEHVADISLPGSFEEVFRKHPDIDYVLHTSSPFHFDVKDIEKELLIPAIQGTKSVLEAAKKFGNKVQKVVVLSSYASVHNSPDPILTEKSWNPVTYIEAQENPLNGYMASKTFAERAAWDFIKEENNPFALSTICVPLVFGPVINDITLKNLNTSNALFLKLIDPKDPSYVPPGDVQFYVDVRDVAKAHIDAIEISESDGHRLLITPGDYCSQDFLDVYHAKGPKDYAKRLPIGTPGSGATLKANVKVKPDNHITNDILGFKYLPYEKTIVDTLTSVIEIKDNAK